LTDLNVVAHVLHGYGLFFILILAVLELWDTWICIALYHDSSLKRSGMARVNQGLHSFTCRPHVYPQVE